MRIEKLTFNAGRSGVKNEEKTAISPSSITVFIGPNNGGKSAALREIHSFCGRGPSTEPVFQSIDMSPVDRQEISEKMRFLTGYDSDFEKKDQINISLRGVNTSMHGPSMKYIIENFISGQNVGQFYQSVLQYFAINLDGMNRLNLVNSQSSQKLSDRSQTTIAEIFKQDELREQISKVVHDAFGKYLLVDPTAMHSFQYALADEKISKDLEKSFGNDAVEFFSRCTPILQTSDGTKAFVGIIAEVMAGYHEVLLIDEPEAFLHPGLAYLLGSEISKHIGTKKQLFVATHSPHFLMGCMSVGLPVNIVRLTYRSNVSSARLLPADELKPMMYDPLLKSVGVISALFYESAVVVEADGDRAFYEEINSRLAHYDEGSIRHATFLNAHNKQEAAYIARVLRNVGIPAAIILDLDWIKEDGKVAKKYFDGAGIPEEMQSGLLETRRRVRELLIAKAGSEKTITKNGGVSTLESGALATANAFFDQMDKFGLFTVRNGELENWLGSLNVDVGKSEWLAKMFEKMGSDPTSSTFIKPSEGDVWSLIRSVGEWVKNPNREGMDFVRPISWLD